MYVETKRASIENVMNKQYSCNGCNTGSSGGYHTLKSLKGTNCDTHREKTASSKDTDTQKEDSHRTKEADTGV